MGVVAAVREQLDRGEVQVVPSTLPDPPPGSVTFRDLLCEAVGVHRRAGTLSYFEHQALRDVLGQVTALLSATAGGDVHLWAAERSRRQADVVDLFARVNGDVDVPPAPTLRPWCDPGEIRTCRIPFVPFAAAVHALAAAGTTHADLVQTHQLASCDPWELLARLDPLIAGTEPPAEVTRAAMVLRARLTNADPPVHSPGRFLADVAVRYPEATPWALVELDTPADGTAKVSA